MESRSTSYHEGTCPICLDRVATSSMVQVGCLGRIEKLCRPCADDVFETRRDEATHRVRLTPRPLNVRPLPDVDDSDDEILILAEEI